MRAMVVHEHGGLEALVPEADWPAPAPGPDEVLIDVEAAGVNFPDLLTIEGTYQHLPERPFVPGKEVAGRVAAVGSRVTHLPLGTRVMAQLDHGGYAERVVAPAAWCFPMPPGVEAEAAAAAGLVYLTAHFALVERGRFRAGETVLVSGATGGVGHAAIQLVKAWGGTALAGVTTPDKAAVAREAGADHVIDLSGDDLRESLRRQVFAVTDGRGVDLFVDPLGGDVFDAGLRAVAWCGRAVVVGFAAGRIPTVRANYLLVKNIEVSGLQISDYRARRPDLFAQVQGEIYALMAEGRIGPRIQGRYPLERAREALAVLRDRGVRGRVVLTIG